MPMTDDKIKEIYIMAVEAFNNGQQNIPIHIFPTRMNDKGMALLKQQTTYSTYSAFWNNLQTGYNYFETKKLVPSVTVDESGNYVFK
jgi:murein L,D-transpeptidase YafK